MPYALRLRTHTWTDGKSTTSVDESHPFAEDCPYEVADCLSYGGVEWTATEVETADDDRVLVTCERFINTNGESRPGDHQAMTIDRRTTGLQEPGGAPRA